MKILIFSWKDLRHPWAGGSEVNMHEQARRWVERGHEVTIYTSRPKGTPRRDNIDGVEILRAGSHVTSFLLAPIYYLGGLRHRADVILDIINGIPFSSPLFSRKPVVGLVHHVHRDMFIPELGQVLGRLGRFIERYLVPLIYMRSPMVCVSNSTASEIRNKLFLGRHMDLRVVFNGIDCSQYAPDGSDRFERPTVLYLGRLKPYKQLPRLIRIMMEVRKRVPEVELLVAGAGEAILEAQAEVQALDADGFIRFLWEVDEKEKVELYRWSWVTATASTIEGWGLTVIEANACGTPAVAFNVPGLNESIISGKTGLLSESDEEFAEHLVKVLTDSELRQRLARQALEWSNNFSWQVTAEQTLGILEEAVANRESHQEI